MPSNTPRVKLYTSLDVTGHKSAQRVLEGVANSRCMIVVGAGISVEAQIQDYRSPGGLFASSFNILGERFKGKDIFTSSGGTKPKQLAALNCIMTTLRQHARSVPLTDFHRLVQTMLDSDRAIRCLTRNFDGLETRDRPDISSKVIELHGNNNSLSCPEGHVPVGPEGVSKFDANLLKGDGIACPTCMKKGEDRSVKDRRLRNIATVYNLRPAVYLDERLVPDLQNAEVRTELFSLASSCQVLLIAGTSLSTDHAFQLVMDLAEKVHESEGVVVFINIKDLSKSRIAHFVDFYMQIDVQTCARFIHNLIAQQESFVEQQGKDIWMEFAERDLTGSVIPALPPLSIPLCCQCAHPLGDVLHPCTTCGRTYCFESPHHNLGRMCVALDKFAAEPQGPFEERIKEFICPDCYPYEEGSVYPHLVRTPRFYYEAPENPKSLLLVMYYLGQFWALSEHIEGCIVSAWTSEGWACSTTQIRLQNLYEHPEKAEVKCSYEAKTYKLLVVYVTHGVSDHGLFQIGDNVALSAEKFLEITTKPISDFIRSSNFSVAIFLTCGQVYDSVENALQIQKWITLPDTYNSIIGTLNKRLAPAYLASFIAQAASNLLGYDRWDQRMVLDAWLRNTLSCTHTDLVYFGKSEEPQLFMFSPMRSRPLGRGLPSIHMTCKCEPNERTGSRKKYWIVKHRGSNDMMLNEIYINLKCSLCNNAFHLMAQDHQGKLVKIAGLFAAVVPYFLK